VPKPVRLPLDIHRRLVLAVAVAVAIALAVLTAGFNVLLSARLERDADAVLRSRAEARLATLTLDRGRLTVEDPLDDARLGQRAWVYDRRGPVLRAPGSAAVQRAVATLVASGDQGVQTVGDDVKLLARPAFAADRRTRLGTVVVSVSRAPYESTERTALVATLVLDGILLVFVLLLASSTVTAALRPVGRMTAQAEDWSAHDPDKRFGLGPPRDELTALAATLDRLLDRVTASLRHEQRFSAEVAHELRTPLAGVRGAAELALRHPRPEAELRAALEDVVAGTERMSRVVDTLVQAARADARTTAATGDIGGVATSVVEAHRAAAEERGVALDVRLPAHALRVGTEEALAAQILGPVVENAIRYGRSRATVAVSAERDGVLLLVSDDGPGIGADEAEAVFAPGSRGRAGGAVAGAGLGLSLARRLARAAGGDVVAAAGGVAVHLPAG
jgi:two-component system, OmpR family, sensor kinase